MKKNVSLVFDRRHRATATRTAPVEYAVPTRPGVRRYLPTGVRLFAGEWDGEKVVGRPDAARLNAELESSRLKANGQIVAAISIYGELRDEDVDRIFGVVRPGAGRERPLLFVPWARAQNDVPGVAEGTRRHRAVVINKIEELGFMRTFADLTPARVKRFDDCLHREGRCCEYTIYKSYHKTLRWLCRLALSEEMIERNPYDVFRPRTAHARPRRPLTEAELLRLRRALLPERLARVRDLFVFCAYTGLAFSDSQSLSCFEIVERGGLRFIDATRRKTGVRFLTPLLDPASAVLERYRGRLPAISLQKANVYLHEIERLLRFPKPLTTHIARHTFATTVALAHGVPIESLAQMMGHRDIKTTQVYARVLAETVVNDGAELAGKIE